MTLPEFIESYGAARLARAVDVDESTVSRWKKGATPIVSHCIRLVEVSDGQITWDAFREA